MVNSINTKKRNIAIAILACLLILILFIFVRPSRANILDAEDLSLYDTWDGESKSDGLVGEGTKESPYMINTAKDFALFSYFINTDCDNFCDKVYYLKQNINLNNYNFEPLGTKDNPFTGTFDGNGYSIARVKINSDMEYVGVFAYLDGATIKDLNLKETTINGVAGSSIGTIAGVINNSTVNNIGIYDSIINVNDANVGLITGTSSNSNYSVLFINGVISSNEELQENLVGVSNNSKYDFILNYAKHSPNTYLLETDEDELGDNIFEYNYENDEITFYKNEGEEEFVTPTGITDIAIMFNQEIKDRFTWKVDREYLRFDNTSNIRRQAPMLKSARVQPTATITAHNSGREGTTIYVNDRQADWDYYQGLNYTYSLDDGVLPTGEDQGKYDETNMVEMQITFNGSDSTGSYVGYVSTTERFNKMVYYHYYPVNNNGTSSNKNDDYVEFELIDHPWGDRPTDLMFHGWVTTYTGAKLYLNTDYYYRYARIPVTYNGDTPNSIVIEFFSTWLPGKYSNTSNDWDDAFAELDSDGIHQLTLEDTYIYNLPTSPDYYTNYELEYGDSCRGMYRNGDRNPRGNCTCNSYYGCTNYYQVVNNANGGVRYDPDTTYYTRNNNYNFNAATINTNNLILVDTIVNPLRTRNLAGFYIRETKANGSDISGYVNQNGVQQGTCSGTCNVYRMINLTDSQATYSSSTTYYYLTTRDTNIIALTNSTNDSWSSSEDKKFTFTGINNHTKYNTTWTIATYTSGYWGGLDGIYVKAYNDTRIEYINTSTVTSSSADARSTANPSTSSTATAYIYGNEQNLKIGRGMGRTNGANNFLGAIGGNNSTSSEGSNSLAGLVKYRFIVESGYYNNIILTNGPISSSDSSRYYKYFAAQGIYGNDIDRVGTNGTNINTNLDVYMDANGTWGGVYLSNTTYGLIFDTVVKSGTFGSSEYDHTTGIYIGGRAGGTHRAAKRLKMEGGYVYNMIGGPLTQSGRTNTNDTYFAMTGGTCDAVYGGAGTSATAGNRILQITGGTVTYSVFGGSNGYNGSNGDGTINGSSFIYIGGHATIGDEDKAEDEDDKMFGFTSGNVFGIGNGRSGTNYIDIGSMTNSNVVVDGDCTIYGSVFGGGNFGHTGTSGSTTTTIQILNGDIKGSVYGGGNNNGSGTSNITATNNITMSGGTVGKSVFGGACTQGVIYGGTNVTVTGGTVKQNVYGGGEGGIETSPASNGTYVQRGVNVVIGNTSLSTTPTIQGTVYGGSAFGTVNDTANNTTTSNYGTNVTVNKGNISGDVFGGSQGDADHTPYVDGNIVVTINGGAITGSVYGTNDAAGRVNGTATVYLNGGTMGNAFGGGNAVETNVTNIYLQGATVTNNVYGGGNQAGATTTNVHVTSGSAAKVFGGSNQSGNVTTTNVDVQRNGTLTVTDVYGGNNAGGTVTNANVNVTSSTVTNVYGGNNLGGTTTTPKVIISGSNITNVYGGGNQAQTTGNTSVTITNTTVTAALYGGGNAAKVDGNTSVNLTSVTAKQVFGGGNAGDVGGNTTVIIRTSTIKDTSGTITDNIFGGGNSAAVEGDTHVTLVNVNSNNVFGGGNAGDVEGNAHLEVDGGTMTGNIYGGGNSADVTGSSNTTIDGAQAANIFGGGNSGTIGTTATLDINDTTVTDTIYGAGNAAAVTGNVTTTITGTTTASYIYGGGNNGSVGADISLTATGTTVTNDIYGAGKGATATATGSTTTTLSNVRAKNVYGGGNAGSVGGNTSTTISSGSAISNEIYGGGNQAGVTGNTVTNVSNSSAKNIFGGGNAGAVGGTANTTVNATTVTNDIYGGGNAAAVSGTTTSSITNTHATNIYGGGNQGATGAISQTIDSSIVNENIYGAGKGATATSTGVTSIVRNTTRASNIFGGGNAGPVNGSVSLTVNNATALTNIYGGGDAANVSGTCSSTLTTATAQYIYGGGNNGSCGNTDIRVNTSTVSHEIYGGGKGATATVTGNVTGAVSSTNAVNIFGGGNAGPVTGDISMDVTGGTISNSIYGGGNQASVGGDTETTITDVIAVEVYGGGNNGAVGGTTTTIVDDSSISSDIYGGGKGATATVGNGTDLTVRNGTTANNVFGGGNAGKVTGNVTVNTNGSSFTYNIYGGGNQAEVEGNTNVTANTSSACGAYGGGNAGDVDGNTSLSLVSSTMTCPVFGGGNSASVTGNSSLYAESSTIIGNAFGGGNADVVEGTARIIIDDTDITGSVYGGGNSADVYGNATVIVGGDTTVSDSVFGGGNSGAIGQQANNNALTSVNILGGEIGRNVYGGCNTSVVYGATDVNIGASASNPTNLGLGDIDIGGTVFGGGEANASGSADYDYSFISVTQGIDINIDGTGYENGIFKISGSVFGSGNASSSTGPAYIYIAKLGTREEPNCMVSIQRGTRVTISDSAIELSGAVDRTNKYDSVKYSFNRIDELIIKDGAALFLQKNANILKKWKSLASDGTPAQVTFDANGDFATKTADNRLYLLANTNLNVTLDQNAQEFGEVVGMTFLGMYNSYGEGTFQVGMYGDDFENGDTASGSDAIIGGSYVLGLHAPSMNYEIDGFYSNYLNDDMTKIETRYVEPSPPSADYYIWTIGIEATSYEFSITASKYSSLGTHVLSMMDFADGNTKFTLNGFNSEGLLPGVSIVNPANVPKIGLTYDEQNSILGLAVKAESQEWTSANSTIFTSQGTGHMEGDTHYETDNTHTSPSLTFYLYHAKNITDNRDLGAVTLSLQSMRPVNEYEWDVDLINITIYLDEQNYTDDDAYDASITYGRKYEMPSLTSVNITNSSQFTAYYSLIATNTFANIYGQNNEYYHALVSNFALPVGTKITLLDLSDENDIEYFYYQVDQTSFSNHFTQLNTTGETEYKLSEFIYMDSTDKYYDDQVMNHKYYYDNVNLTVEEFVFIVDFEEADINGEFLDNSILFELRTQGRGVISVLGIRQESMVYNLYETSNTVLSANVTYDDNNMYYGIQKPIGYDITVGYNATANLQSIVDTNYESDSMGINIELVDASNNQLTSSLLLGTSIKIGDEEYFPSSDGVFRIKLSNKVANLNRTLILTPGNSLPAGNYTLYINLFSSADGLHMTRGSDLTTVIPLTMVGKANGISVVIQDNSKLINGTTGLNNGDDTSFRGTITFTSSLANTNIRLNVYKRDTTAYDTLTYTEVDPATIISSELPEFSGTGLSPTSTYQALLSANPTSPITMAYAITGTIPSGTYKLVFGLYDNNQEIQTDVKYIIVKID